MKFLEEIPKIKLFSLQKGFASQQIDDKEVINLDKEINDFDDISAIMENLDLIVSTDTSIVLW